MSHLNFTDNCQIYFDNDFQKVGLFNWLNDIKDNTRLAWICGSRINGNIKSGSDFDIFLILDKINNIKKLNLDVEVDLIIRDSEWLSKNINGFATDFTGQLFDPFTKLYGGSCMLDMPLAKIIKHATMRTSSRLKKRKSIFNELIRFHKNKAANSVIRWSKIYHLRVAINLILLKISDDVNNFPPGSMSFLSMFKKYFDSKDYDRFVENLPNLDLLAERIKTLPISSNSVKYYTRIIEQEATYRIKSDLSYFIALFLSFEIGKNMPLAHDLDGDTFEVRIFEYQYFLRKILNA